MKYALGFMFSHNLDKVILIKKNKPRWMSGKFNGVGGKVEEGENFDEAMAREFHEEVGLFTSEEGWHNYASLKSPTWRVEVFTCVAPEDVSLEDICEQQRDTSPEEPVYCFPVSELWFEYLPSLKALNNVSWLVMMARDYIKNGSFAKATIEYPDRW